MTRHALPVIVLTMAGVLAQATSIQAHSGPPYPIVSNRIVGAYDISIWTDPDSTDDGSPGGKFWVVLDAADRKAAIPAGTTASVTIRPLDRPGNADTGRADLVDGAVSRQYVALLMDHEGPFGVHVAVDGPLGRAEVESKVDATYDLRPPPLLLALYLFPFVAVGALWMKVLLRRRKGHAAQR